MRYCLLTMMVLLCACQNPSIRDVATMPHALPETPVDLLAYPVPAIEGYRLQGDAKLEVSQQRVFLYRNLDDSSIRLQLAIYSIPPGWDDMPSARLVAGHFGQVRESVVQHLLRSSGADLEVVDDRLVDSELLPYPLGYAQLRHPDAMPGTYYSVFLSAHQPLFVRMEHIDPSGTGVTPEQAVALMQTVTGALFAGH